MTCWLDKLLQRKVSNPSVPKGGGELSDDDMDSADVKVLCALVKAKEARSWLLAMRQYGANLMLSHDEKASEAMAITIQARLAKQITKRIQRSEHTVFDEPEFSRTIEMIAKWTPSDD